MKPKPTYSEVPREVPEVQARNVDSHRDGHRRPRPAHHLPVLPLEVVRLHREGVVIVWRWLVTLFANWLRRRSEVDALRDINASQAATIQANRISATASKSLYKAAVKEAGDALEALQGERERSMALEAELVLERNRADEAEALVASMRAHPSRHEGEEG